MTVSRISLVCWIIFGVMCLAFLPLAGGILAIHALPETVRVILAVLVVLIVWWGPFGYAMYLSLAVMRNGDRRLLHRGVRGTAEVLSVKRTNTVISEGEFDWEAPRLYKYGLRVSLPGRAPYDTTCGICAAGIAQGSTVKVAVSRRNRQRVTIDVGQTDARGRARPTSVVAETASAGPSHGGYPAPAPARPARFAPDAGRQHDDSERIRLLAQLAQLHKQGDLTDAEFTAQKAKILSD
jgi:hypothetical protein